MFPLPSIKGLRKTIPAYHVKRAHFAGQLKALAKAHLAIFADPGAQLSLNVGDAIENLLERLTPCPSDGNLHISPVLPTADAPFQVWLQLQTICAMEVQFLEGLMQSRMAAYVLVRDILSVLILSAPVADSMQACENVHENIGYHDQGSKQDQQEQEWAKQAIYEEMCWVRHFPKLYGKAEDKKNRIVHDDAWIKHMKAEVRAASLQKEEKKWLNAALECVRFWRSFKWDAPFIKQDDFPADEQERPFLPSFFLLRWSHDGFVSDEQEEMVNTWANEYGAPMLIAEPTSQADMEKIREVAGHLRALQELLEGGCNVWSRKTSTKPKKR